MKRFVSLAALAALVLGLAACQQTTTEPPPPPAPPSEFDQGDDMPKEPMKPPPSPASLGTIYFDFDSSAIREDARDVLRKNAEILRSSGNDVMIEGHCDERGDEEYNLALGERRANAVKKYLVNLGVSSGRLDTISYGESRPAVRGRGESVWQWNRRAEFRRK